MLTSSFEDYDDSYFAWTPKGEPGDWERCECYCHRSGGRMVHCVPCCMGGWKKTFRLIAKEMAALQAEKARKQQKAITYKPAHGGYPG